MQYIIPTTAYPVPHQSLDSSQSIQIQAYTSTHGRTCTHPHTHTHTHTHTQSVTNHPNAVLMHNAVATGTPRVWGLTVPTTNKQLSATELTNSRLSSRFPSKRTTGTSVSILYSSFISLFLIPYSLHPSMSVLYFYGSQSSQSTSSKPVSFNMDTGFILRIPCSVHREKILYQRMPC